jgi:hypothetical protein
MSGDRAGIDARFETGRYIGDLTIEAAPVEAAPALLKPSETMYCPPQWADVTMDALQPRDYSAGHAWRRAPCAYYGRPRSVVAGSCDTKIGELPVCRTWSRSRAWRKNEPERSTGSAGGVEA